MDTETSWAELLWFKRLNGSEYGSCFTQFLLLFAFFDLKLRYLLVVEKLLCENIPLQSFLGIDRKERPAFNGGKFNRVEGDDDYRRNMEYLWRITCSNDLPYVIRVSDVGDELCVKVKAGCTIQQCLSRLLGFVETVSKEVAAIMGEANFSSSIKLGGDYTVLFGPVTYLQNDCSSRLRFTDLVLIGNDKTQYPPHSTYRTKTTGCGIKKVIRVKYSEEYANDGSSLLGNKAPGLWLSQVRLEEYALMIRYVDDSADLWFACRCSGCVATNSKKAREEKSNAGKKRQREKSEEELFKEREAKKIADKWAAHQLLCVADAKAGKYLGKK